MRRGTLTTILPSMALSRGDIRVAGPMQDLCRPEFGRNLAHNNNNAAAELRSMDKPGGAAMTMPASFRPPL